MKKDFEYKGEILGILLMEYQEQIPDSQHPDFEELPKFKNRMRMYWKILCFHQIDGQMVTVARREKIEKADLFEQAQQAENNLCSYIDNYTKNTITDRVIEKLKERGYK